MNTFDNNSTNVEVSAPYSESDTPMQDKRHSSDLYGIWAPCLTPIHENGEINFPKLSEHIEWLLSNGCHGVALFGTTGEASSFSAGERMVALEKVLSFGIPSDRLIVGNGFPAISDTIAVTQHALDHGCNKVMMLPPFYFKEPSVEGLSRSYREVLDQINSSEIRVVLYHFPKMSTVPITHELIDAMISSHGDLIAGLKDSTGDWDSTEAYIRNFPQLSIFPGTDVLLLRGLKVGGAGTITATATINPAGIRKVYDLWHEQLDADDAQEAAEKVRSIAFRYPLSSALKSVHAALRNEPDWQHVRPPLTVLSSEDQSDLMRDLSDIGFELPN